MWEAEEIEDEETLAALLEASRSAQGRAALSDALADTLHLLPASTHRLLLLRLRLLRNLLAGDDLNQGTFVLLSGPAAVVSSALSSPSDFPDVARAGLQALGNAALAGEHHRAAVWEALFPGSLLELARVREKGVLDPLCMVIDTCCSGEGGRARLEELCHEELGLPILVEIVTTAWQVGHDEEWLEWLLFKICVEDQKFETLFAALCSGDDAEHSDGDECKTEFNANHAYLLGKLSKCLANRPKEVSVSISFALDIFNAQKHAAEIVDFTCRVNSPLPTGHPAIDVLGYSLVLLKDICAWESPPSDAQAPVDSLMQTGLVKHLLTYLRELEPPSMIRKSMARGQGDHQPALATAKVCPYIGYRRDVVAVIANCLHRSKKVQDEVRHLDGIILLLQQCVVDEENPYLREWGLFAVKNLLEGNEENQKEVSELKMQEAVITPEIADIGLRVEMDKETGQPKLVNN
uniref:Ataxin-10 domain-containing protein n=1 Tax=Oryza punctata TaxID=4537 RepID=A0A0E0K801_ORYPU